MLSISFLLVGGWYNIAIDEDGVTAKQIQFIALAINPNQPPPTPKTKKKIGRTLDGDVSFTA